MSPERMFSMESHVRMISAWVIVGALVDQVRSWPWPIRWPTIRTRPFDWARDDWPAGER